MLLQHKFHLNEQLNGEERLRQEQYTESMIHSVTELFQRCIATIHFLPGLS